MNISRKERNASSFQNYNNGRSLSRTMILGLINRSQLLM